MVIPIITSAVAWVSLLIYLNLVAPDSFFHLLSFFVFLFVCFLLTSFIFLKKIKRNLIIAIYLLVLVVLAYFHVLNLLNTALVTILLIVSAYLT